jgi:hypothetical protein
MLCCSCCDQQLTGMRRSTVAVVVLHLATLPSWLVLAAIRCSVACTPVIMLPAAPAGKIFLVGLLSSNVPHYQDATSSTCSGQVLSLANRCDHSFETIVDGLAR